MPVLVKGWNALAASDSYAFEFILVDDGSTDGTAAAAQREASNIPLHVLKHSINLGPGKAFATGFSFLTSRLHEGDIVVTMEGDNTSRTETMFTLLGRITRENADVALASPYAYGGGFVHTNFFRIFLSHWASFLTKLFLNIHGIHTFTSFFRAYKASAIIQLQKKYGSAILESPGFECMVELLKKIILQGFSISEVPMRLDTSQRKGKSKMKVMKTMRGYFRVFRKAGQWK